jgi:ubiquinone/menaquinone biosynthesis C-methylase UbiE
MRYVEASAENMPFPDEYFDVVSSLNSLDHVEDVARAIAEMIRVLKTDGSLLLLVEVNHPPTVTEPASLPWELTGWFGPSMRTVFERRYESSGPDWFYSMVFADQRWDDSRKEARPGLLAARLVKVQRQVAG